MHSVICVSGGLITSSTQKVLPMFKPKHEGISKITYVPTHPHAKLTLFRTRGNEVGVTNNSRERGVIKNEGKHRVIQILQLNTPTGSVKESYLPSSNWTASPCVLPEDSLWIYVHCTQPRLEDSSLARAVGLRPCPVPPQADPRAQRAAWTDCLASSYSTATTTGSEQRGRRVGHEYL